MSNYYEESTNFTSNPFNNSKPFLKQKLIENNHSHPFDDENSKTIPHHNLPINIYEDTIKPGKLPQKIKAEDLQHSINNNKSIPLKSNSTLNLLDDDILTKTKKLKNKTNRKITSEVAQKQVLINKNTQKQTHLNNQQCLVKKPKTPQPCPEVQSILSGPKMREKYAHLIPKAHQKSISFEQQNLLKVLSMMDETIQFSSKNRATKFMFFEQLKKIMRDSLRVFIQMRHLQQLLYLDETLFEVKWEWSYDKKGHDIMIVQPKIKSKDERKNRIRQMIIEYLNEKHSEFLKVKGLKIKDGEWHQDFEPGKYQIPRKPVPVHPETREAELRCFQQNRINEIKNPKLKQLIQNKKQLSQVQSFKSKSVMDMIFSGVSSKNIETQILAAVKQKENNIKKMKNEEEQRIQRQKTEIDPEILKQISQTILLIYMSKSVTNLFKVKLVELVKQRTNHKFGSLIVDRHIQHLIELKEIGFLKEVTASANKPIIVQINKSKAKQVTMYAESLRQKISEREKMNQNTETEIII